LASIDEFSREVIKDMEKRVQSPVSHFDPPWFKPHYGAFDE